MNRNVIAAAVIAALGLATSAQADILFNPDGVAGGAPTVSVTGFDWSPGNVLVKNGNAQVLAFTQDPTYNPVTGTVANPQQYAFQVYYQSTLSATLGQPITGLCATGYTSCSGGNYEITLTLAFQEYVTKVNGSTAQFGFLSGGTNFFEIYYDPTKNSNALAGTGYDNGTLIASSTLSNAQVGTFTNTGGTATQNFDQTLDGINNYPGISAIQGTGSQPQLSITVAMPPLSLNPAWFPGSPTLTSWQFNNISLSPFFQSINPSACFDGAAGSGSACLAPAIGTINGFLPIPPGGNDIQLQTDVNSVLIGSSVPEPATLGLIGLALAGLGAVRRRRPS